MWFKCYDWQRPTVEAVTDADAGAGFKAALRLFSGEPIGELSPGAMTVYRALEPYIRMAVDYTAHKDREAHQRPTVTTTEDTR